MWLSKWQFEIKSQFTFKQRCKSFSEVKLHVHSSKQRLFTTKATKPRLSANKQLTWYTSRNTSSLWKSPFSLNCMNKNYLKATYSCLIVMSGSDNVKWHLQNTIRQSEWLPFLFQPILCQRGSTFLNETVLRRNSLQQSVSWALSGNNLLATLFANNAERYYFRAWLQIHWYSVREMSCCHKKI